MCFNLNLFFIFFYGVIIDLPWYTVNPVIFSLRRNTAMRFYADLKGKYELDSHGSSCTNINVLTNKLNTI